MRRGTRVYAGTDRSESRITSALLCNQSPAHTVAHSHCAHVHARVTRAATAGSLARSVRMRRAEGRSITRYSSVDGEIRHARCGDIEGKTHMRTYSTGAGMSRARMRTVTSCSACAHHSCTAISPAHHTIMPMMHRCVLMYRFSLCTVAVHAASPPLPSSPPRADVGRDEFLHDAHRHEPRQPPRELNAGAQ
jgi:hypothetical protein